MEFFWMILKLIIALATILALMLLLYKLSNKKISNINSNKYINVIDRVQMGKDSYILIVKIGKKGYVMSSSGGRTEKIEDLSEDEMLNIQNEKEKRIEENNIKYEETMETIKKIILKLKKKSGIGGNSGEK